MAPIPVAYIELMGFLRQLQAIYTRCAPPLGTWLPRLGVALLAVAAVFAAQSWLFGRTQQRSIATVTDNVSTFAPKGGVLYHPSLRFRTPAGETVHVLAPGVPDEPDFEPGDVLPVLYPPGHPEAAIIATVWHAYHAAIVFALYGILFFDVGLILRRLSKVDTA